MDKVKRIKSRIENAGVLEDFELKKLHVEQRLSDIFAAFIKTSKNSGYFLAGAGVPPHLMSVNGFHGILLGNTRSDLAFGDDLIREIGSNIASAFSPKDFHSTVARDFLSRCLRRNFENMDKPVGFAFECMLYDPRNHVIRINFIGDVEEDNLGEVEEDILLIGAYGKEFKEKLMAELGKAPRSVETKEFLEFIETFKKKFKLKYVGVLGINRP